MEALQLLVIHLLEEISIGGPGNAQNVNSTLAETKQILPPLPPVIPAGAKRSFSGSITSLELLRDVKEALIHRVEPEQQERFKNELTEIEEKIKKLKGEI